MSTLLDVKNLGISFGGLRAVNDFTERRTLRIDWTKRCR